jgi:signal transduction histidine kinase
VTARARSWWTVYAACALLAVAALGWITHLVIGLERAEASARAEAEQQANLRLALWRMDSFVGPLIAREAARAFYEYQPYHPQEQAYTRVLATLDPGSILAPSPLLTFHSDAIRLHFQIDAHGAWTSPQVPQGNELDLAQGTYGLDARMEERRLALASLSSRTDRSTLAALLARNESALVSLTDESWIAQCQVLGAPEQAKGASDDIARNSVELTQRARQVAEINAGNPSWAQTPSDASSTAAVVRTGPLVPIWLAGPEQPSELLFLRRAVGGSVDLLQGFLVDWGVLSSSLQDQVRDLFPAVTFVPRIEGRVGDARGLQLATLPVAIEVPLMAPSSPLVSAVARLTIALPWLGLAAALVAVGLTLRASIDIAERRSRFASSVTHELRTPLTTFRMYSEMLATGMVPEEKRASYHQTLERESVRLSGLVESVLAYSRLEEGRARLHRETIGARELLERSRPDLERRALLAGALLTVETADLDGARLTTDPAAVHQILFNLIDNACKYGLAPERPEIVLAARVEPRMLTITLRDFGAGIPHGLEERIFEPFDRGARDASDPHPGIGLGLALARGLARDLGGELRLDPESSEGACFDLALPIEDTSREI